MDVNRSATTLQGLPQQSQLTVKPYIVPTTINTTSKLLDRKKNNTYYVDGTSSVERTGSPLSVNSIDEPPLSLQDLNDDGSIPSEITGGSTKQQPQRRRSLIDRKKNKANTAQAESIEMLTNNALTTITSSAAPRPKVEERDISAMVSQFTSSVKLSMIQTISPVVDHEVSEDSALDMSNETPNSLLDGEDTEFTGPIVPELSALPCFFEDFAPFSDQTRRKSKNPSPHSNNQQQQQRRSSDTNKQQILLKKPAATASSSLSYSRDMDDTHSVGGSSVNSDNGVKRISSIQPFHSADFLRPHDTPTSHKNPTSHSAPAAKTNSSPMKSTISGLFQSIDTEILNQENTHPNPATTRDTNTNTGQQQQSYDAVIAGMVMHHYYAKLIDLLLEGIRPGILKIFRLIELITYTTPSSSSTEANTGTDGGSNTLGGGRRRSFTTGGSMISVRGSILGGMHMDGASNTNSSSSITNNTNTNINNTTNAVQRPRRRSSMMNMLDTDSLQLLESITNKVSVASNSSNTKQSTKGAVRRGSSILIPSVNVNYQERSQELAHVFALLTQVHNTNEIYKIKVQQMIGYMLGLESTDDFLSHVVCLQEANEFFQDNPKSLLNGKMWDISHLFYSSKLLLYFFGKDDFKSPNTTSTTSSTTTGGGPHGLLSMVSSISANSANHLMLQKSPAVIDDVLSMELFHCLPISKELFQLLFSLEKQYKQSFAQFMTNPILMRRLRKQAIAATKKGKANSNTTKGATTMHIPIRATSRQKRSQSIMNSPLTLKRHFKIPTLAVNVEQMIAKTESVIAKLLYLLVPHHLAIMEVMYRISLMQQSCTRNSSYFKMIGRKDLYKILKKCASAMDMQLNMDVTLLARAPETIGQKIRFDMATMNTALNGNKISEKIHSILMDLDNQYGVIAMQQGHAVAGSSSSLTTTALQSHNQQMNIIEEEDTMSIGSRSSGGLESYSSMKRPATPSTHKGSSSSSLFTTIKPDAVPMLTTGRDMIAQMHSVIQQSHDQLQVINQYRDALEQQREATNQTKLLDLSSSSSEDNDDDDDSETSEEEDDGDEEELEDEARSVQSDAMGSRSDESSVNSRTSKSNPPNHKILLPVGSNLTTGSMNLFDSFTKTSKLTNHFPEMHILSNHTQEQDKHFDKLAYDLSLLHEEFHRKVQDLVSLTIEDMDMLVKSNVSVHNISKKILESSFKRDESILPSIAVLLLRTKSKELLQSVYITWPLLTLDIPVTVTSTAPIVLGSHPTTAPTISSSTTTAAEPSTPRMITSPSHDHTNAHKRRTSLSLTTEGLSSTLTGPAVTTIHPSMMMMPTIPHLVEEFQPTLTRKLDFLPVDFTNTKSLRKIGFSLLQLRDSQLFTWSQLLAAGYPLPEIKHLRHLSTNPPIGNGNNLMSASTSSFILTAAGAANTNMPSGVLFDGDIPQHELTVSELRKAGYSIEQCVEAGFHALALKAGGFDELQLVQSGLFTASQLKKAGCDVQRFALTTFFQAMEGKYWRKNTNWCTEKPLGEWYGVKVNQQGAVIYIDLRNNQLTGELPEALYLLSSLEYLDLYNNFIRGKVPILYKSLLALKDIWLDGSNIIEDKKAQVQSLLPHCRIRVGHTHSLV